MNKELLDKLQFQAAAQVNPLLKDREWQRVYIQKYTELIIKECAELLETNGNNQHTITTVEPESHSKSADWREGYEEAVQQYGGFLLKKNAKLIKNHFGVEE